MASSSSLGGEENKKNKYFTEILTRFRENPTREPSSEEVIFIKELMDSYAVTDAYDKLIEFMDVFFHYYVSSNSDILDRLKKDTVNPLASSSFLKRYPILNMLKTANHPALEKLIPNLNAFHALTLGKMIRDSQFPGWTITPKSKGADPGFILTSPDKYTCFYAKRTSNVYEDLLSANILSRLSVKMAESDLAFADGHPFLLTRDMTREYQKSDGHYVKKKRYTTFQGLFKGCNEAAFGLESLPRGTAKAKEEQQSIVAKFVSETMSSEKSRVSLSKLILCCKAFGLSDVFSHGGNIGIIETEKQTLGEPVSKRYIKFGLVDYKFFLTEHTVTDIKDRDGKLLDVKLMMENLRGVMGKDTVFAKMFDRLTEEDFRKAALELSYPKDRIYSYKGHRKDLLLQSPTSKKVSAHEMIHRGFTGTIQALYKGLRSKEVYEIRDALSSTRDLMHGNLRDLTDVFLAPPTSTPIVTTSKP